MSVLLLSTLHFGPVPRDMGFRLAGHMEHRREPMFVWWNTSRYFTIEWSYSCWMSRLSYFDVSFRSHTSTKKCGLGMLERSKYRLVRAIRYRLTHREGWHMGCKTYQRVASETHDEVSSLESG